MPEGSEWEQVRHWLWRSQSGCAFASRLAKDQGGITSATFATIATPEQLDGLLDYAADQHKPALAVLTAARTESDLVDQLLALAGGERWRVRRVPTPGKLATSDVFVGLEWRTAATPELWSSPMGLGPFGTMPPTRRAPYTVIATWPGGRENTFNTRRDPVVHFLDTNLSAYRLTAKSYDKLTKTSLAATRAILVNDSARNYRNVAFRLSSSAGPRLASLPMA